MNWLTILLWLLKTIGPYLLELIIEWIINNLPKDGLQMPAELEYEAAMQALPNGVAVPRRQYNLAKKLVQKYPDKLPQVRARIQREKARCGNVDAR